MAQISRTFRVFVSSTFSDLVAERNSLQEKVFPRLRDLAATHGYRFQAIDLRWGVSDEASLDQQAMAICLGEIKRCQQTSPRPNFIVLLGDRYGWCPPPAQIPAEEFKQILEVIKLPEDKALLENWYFQDKNAVPGEWRLKPRLRGDKYEKFDNWQPVEARLHAILAEAVGTLNFTPEQRLPFIASATEQEIASGALRVMDAPEHVLCFLRSLSDLPQQFSASDFQVKVAEKLKQVYPGGLSQSCLELVKNILVMSPDSAAKDFAERIKQSLKAVLNATTENEVLNVIQQVLVDFTAKDFRDLDENEWTVDEIAHTKQKELKKLLQSHIPEHIFRSQARWTGYGITTDHIGTLPGELEKCMPFLEDDYSPGNLCEAVWISLARIIQQEIRQPHEIKPAEEIKIHIQPDEELDVEGLAHHKFAEERLTFFVGRTEMLKEIAGYLGSNERRCLAIVGGGGTGKTALMARAIQQTQAEHPNAEIVYRFIGATPGSSDGRSLLYSLCHEISRRYKAEIASIPSDFYDLVPLLGKCMSLASVDRPLILFLDSLDQLSPSQGVRSLDWLPVELPEHAFVITSTREGDTHIAMQARQARQEALGGLSRQEGDNLLSQWLRSVRRTLQGLQRKEVLDKFLQSGGNPLYLKLAFEEARLWTSAPDQPQEQLEPGVKGIIRKNMIDRLKNEGNHGEALVAHALGYLVSSRFGLTEDEIIDLLSRDLQVYGWFFENNFHLPADLVRSAIQYRRNHPGLTEKEGRGSLKDEERAARVWLKEIRNLPKQEADFLSEVLPSANGPRLPIVLWSRLSFDLAPYLAARMVEGSSLLNFYHRELGEVSKELFLGGGQDQSYHARLADYFRCKADPCGDCRWSGGSSRGLAELPYHLSRAGKDDELYETLTDYLFLQHKITEAGVAERVDDQGKTAKMFSGVYLLQEDFGLALAQMGGGEASDGRMPIIVTGVDFGNGLVVNCPWCHKQSPFQQEWCGTDLACPQCQGPLRVNKFVVGRQA